MWRPLLDVCAPLLNNHQGKSACIKIQKNNVMLKGKNLVLYVLGAGAIYYFYMKQFANRITIPLLGHQ